MSSMYTEGAKRIVRVEDEVRRLRSESGKAVRVSFGRCVER